MLRYIKRKVNENREENGHDAGSTVSDPPHHNNNGNSHHSNYDVVANNNNNNTAGGVARNISNKIRNRVNNNNNTFTLESLAEQQRQLDTAVLAPLSHLANFDACIGAADALAAASSSQPSSDHTAMPAKNAVADCSVLVSPDGDLLLMPQPKHASSSSVVLSQQQELGEDYKAAIYVGNDYCDDDNIEAPTTNTAGSGGGDAHRNGFTANGWSIPAASLALRQTQTSLHDFSDFCEEIVLSKTEAAARSSVACDKLLRPTCDDNDCSGGTNPGRYPVDLQQDAELMKQVSGGSAMSSNSVNAFDVVPGRVGPMRFQGGTLHAAHVALEEFYYKMSECESHRWRLASFPPQQSYSSSGTNNINNQGLPALRKAATQAEERSSNRQKTLREMYTRVKLMEDHLSACQQFANTKWNDVQLAEERVTKLIEERTLERSRKREKQRLQEFHQAGAQHQLQQNQNQLGANKEEIWNLVSQVSESMENGSFEPIHFPQQPSLAGEPSATSQAPTPPPMEELPPLSRFDVEDEVGLQEYRMAAVAADRAVQDASGSLLNVLSSLDQVRRSARISAETNLLSSCQAQAACIRSIVRLERAAAEERLEHIKKLEKYADSIDVRSDLNIYIHTDRKRAGGSAPLGQDDDGGIASALAVLTSHQEGNMGTGTPSTLYNNNSKTNGDQANGGKESVAEHVSSEALEEALEALFSIGSLPQPEAPDTEERTQAQAKFKEAVKLLSDIAEEKSMAARPKRSRMCYALNAKRASHTEIKSPMQFDGLCKVFIAILNGCDCESGGVSNAKMCMMLSQSFYLSEKFNGGEENEEERSKRVYIKNRLIGHPLWNHEEFWYVLLWIFDRKRLLLARDSSTDTSFLQILKQRDLVLFQCLSESLTNSGVMTNFERLSASDTKKTEWKESRKLQWFDLTPAERLEAASQVHAVVTAQLGAISHSMIEFGCNLQRACAFVRRMAIRNQLPLSQRAILLQHLVERKNDNDSERVESQHELGMPFSDNEGGSDTDKSDEKTPEATPSGGTDQERDTTQQSNEEVDISKDPTSPGIIESDAEEVKSGATGEAAETTDTAKQSEDGQPEQNNENSDDEPAAVLVEDSSPPNEEADNAGATKGDESTSAEQNITK